MGEILFSLAFRIEAIITVETGLLSLRVEEYNKDTNFEWLRANLHLHEESRECTTMRMASYCQKVAKYYNA